MSRYQRKVTFFLPDGTGIDQVHHGPGDRPPTDAEMQSHTSALFKAQPGAIQASILISVDGVDIIGETELDRWTGT